MNTQESISESPLELKSPIEGVSGSEWSQFVRVMAARPVESVSASNAIGAFELKPLRLLELGVLDEKKSKRVRGKSGRMIWIGVFKDPRYGARLMRSLSLQYEIFSKSMVDYASKIQAGSVRVIDDLSLSGRLALCHKPGPRGILVTKANGIF